MELCTGLLFFVNNNSFGPKISQFSKFKNKKITWVTIVNVGSMEQLKCKSVKFVTLGSEWIKIESNTFVNLGSG